jgi:hypothetical protein
VVDELKQKPGPKRSHDNVMKSPQGNSRSYTLDRLEREAPDLYAEVLQGNLKANAAAVVGLPHDGQPGLRVGAVLPDGSPALLDFRRITT